MCVLLQGWTSASCVCAVKATTTNERFMVHTQSPDLSGIFFIIIIIFSLTSLNLPNNIFSSSLLLFAASAACHRRPTLLLLLFVGCSCV